MTEGLTPETAVITVDKIFNPKYDEKSRVGKIIQLAHKAKIKKQFMAYDDDGILYYQGLFFNGHVAGKYLCYHKEQYVYRFR